jgi:hypothetical protein
MIDRNKIVAIVDEIKQDGSEDTDIYVDAILGVINEHYDKINELSVTYTPDAIRDSVDSYDEGDAIKVAVENATDEELLDIAYMIVGSDPIWSRFHEDIDSCVREKFDVKED